MNNSLELALEEIEYLDANHQGRWQRLDEGGGEYGLLIEGFAIPAGFNQSTADLMVLIPLGYPGTSLDMFYIDPPLSKKNGRDIKKISMEEHFARQWQRWSRHYDWSPGEDDLIRHIEYIRNELQVAGEE
ncbi:MAG: hypothetical protein OXC62_16130 [Aestuariivita sp.]|nr:hypothetical protein [Aestuariivita sp.]